LGDRLPICEREEPASVVRSLGIQMLRDRVEPPAPVKLMWKVDVSERLTGCGSTERVCDRATLALLLLVCTIAKVDRTALGPGVRLPQLASQMIRPRHCCRDLPDLDALLPGALHDSQNARVDFPRCGLNRVDGFDHLWADRAAGMLIRGEKVVID